MEPSGGIDMVEYLEKVVSAREGAGRSALVALGCSPFCGAAGWGSIVVGSIEPFSLMEGGVLSAIM